MSPWSGAVLWSVTPARAQGSGVQWGHCLPLSGDLKYPAGFKHFDYVNPQAPKGGTLRLAALGTFDNFNQVVAGLKGLFAAAAGTICDTLMMASLDEPMANYGLIAEAVGHSRELYNHFLSPARGRAPPRRHPDHGRGRDLFLRGLQENQSLHRRLLSRRRESGEERRARGHLHARLPRQS